MACAQLSYTTRHRTVQIIIFPSNLQKTISVLMLSFGGEGNPVFKKTNESLESRKREKETTQIECSISQWLCYTTMSVRCQNTIQPYNRPTRNTYKNFLQAQLSHRDRATHCVSRNLVMTRLLVHKTG